MLLYRIQVGSEIFYAQGDVAGYRRLDGDPFSRWAPTGSLIPEAQAVRLAPCLPSKIVAVGLNYRSHASELNLPIPDEPLIFLKPPTSLAGPGDAIAWPPSSQHLDYEGEMAVVIGKFCRHVPEAAAGDYILGYTLANDVTARDLQKRDGQWTRAKGFDGFCPLGPAIVTGMNPQQLEFKTLVNGETRQRGSVRDLIHPIPRLIAFISGVMSLLPGDVILTGTPPGIGPLKRGDRVRIESASIGTLENTMV